MYTWANVSLKDTFLREFCPIEMSKDGFLSLFLINQIFLIKKPKKKKVLDSNLEIIATNVRPCVDDWKRRKSIWRVYRGVGGDSLLDGAPPLALLSESVTGDGAEGDVDRAGSGGMSPSFIRFFCFIRRFWNQILICRSVRLSILER